MDEVAKILSYGANGAVVQLPGRHYPGIVIQGDSLSVIVHELDEIRSSIDSGSDKEEMLLQLDELLQQIRGRLWFYEKTLEQRGDKLPYIKRDGRKNAPCHDGDRLDAWYDGSAICIIAKGSHGDPLDLGESEAIEFRDTINRAIESSRQEGSGSAE